VPEQARPNRIKEFSALQPRSSCGIGFWPESPRPMPQYFLIVEPLVGTLLGVIILNERRSAVGILGGTLILFSAAYSAAPRDHER
jgi:hypothetical protein